VGIGRVCVISSFVCQEGSSGCKPPTETLAGSGEMLIKRLCNRLHTRDKGSKVLSMLGKSLNEILVHKLGDHLGEMLGEIKTIHLQL
jgi:hypothetical protein